MATNLVKFLVSIILVVVLLIVGCFFYSKSQLKLGVEVTNERVNAVFNSPKEREEFNIPIGVELKKTSTTFVDYGIRGAEIIYPCEPEGHVYVTFNATKGILLFSMFNKKNDFDIQISSYNKKNIDFK